VLVGLGAMTQGRISACGDVLRGGCLHCIAEGRKVSFVLTGTA
jgi:hypothetical protein